MPRNKHDNIQSKSQSFAGLMATGVIAPEDALAMADMTTDITGVVERGKDYQEENAKNAEKGVNTSIVYHSGSRTQGNEGNLGQNGTNNQV